MPGDYSRRLFRKNKHYSGVLMQQGRVQLDADWNEQLDLQLYRTDTEAIDVIGSCGVPRKNGGFLIGSGSGGQDLTISAGRIYVDGLLCELEQASTYTTQPYLPNPDLTSVITSPPTSPPGPTRRLSVPDGHYVIYLDAWQQERTALDDQLIREVALGGPDTTTRLQNVWQVKLQRVAVTSPPTSPPGGFVCKTAFPEFQQLTAASTGTLNARTSPPKPEDDPCLLPPTSGYSGLENLLYRIEIQNGGTLTVAGGPVTFKWSRDNASVETSVVSISTDLVTVKDTGKDELLSFANNQWVEVVDEESTLKATPRPLVQTDSVPTAHEINFKTSLQSFASLIPGLKLRRWDQSGSADENGLPATPNVWLDIEAGVQVQFSPGTYRSGDYWLIPARTITREIEWPPFKIPNTQPIPQPPRGVRHHFCRLALLEVNNGLLQLKDCRPTFPPLTELLNFFHVGGTGQEGAPSATLPCPLEVGVTNGHLPVSGARVRFAAGPGAGVLHATTGSGLAVIVETDQDGVAQCVWELGAAQQRPVCLQVEATLLDDQGQPLAPALHFNASHTAGVAAEPGIVVRRIIATADNEPLENDQLVPVSRLRGGIMIVCDQAIAPNAGGGSPPPPSILPDSAIAGKPTCYVTLDLPYPIGGDVGFWDFTGIFGFQPLILGGQVSIKEQAMVWIPSTVANDWLQRILFNRLLGRQITDRVLAHLTIKGNFIFARGNPNLNLDGDVFGRPTAADRIDLDLPSGDNRRGGDLNMWFWLTPPEAPIGLASLVLNPTAVIAGNPSQGTITLNRAAPTGGAVISILSSNTGMATVPTAITVPAGATSTTFPIQTIPGGAGQVTITANFGGASLPAQLTLVRLVSLTVAPTQVGGGDQPTGTVNLSGVAPPGGAVVNLSVPAPLSVPPAVTVPPGKVNASFVVRTVVGANGGFDIRGSLNGVEVSARLLVITIG